MRHQKSGRRLGRNSPHRKAMYSNMVASLIMHGRIETTEPKAKELRKKADRAVAWAVSVADVVDAKKASPADKARVVHAMRMAGRTVKNIDALRKLFHEVGPGLASRPGGFTRLLKTRFRRGDAASMALVELMPADPAKGKKAKKAEPAADDAAAKPAKKAKADKADKAPKAEKKPAKKAKSKKDE